MVMLDAFNSSNFNVVSLTTALDKMPYQPNWLGNLGLFRKRPIPTTTAVIEERHGRLSLVQTSARGTNVETNNRKPRVARSFVVPHLAQQEGILADDVQNIRAFGSETETETLATLINDRMVAMRDNVEVTKEYHRYGAISGVTYDSDMSTAIYNYFTEFGITQTVVDFVLGTATTDVKGKCQSVVRSMHSALGASMLQGVVALCSDTFFDALVTHAEVETAYARWQDGRLLRTLQSGGAGYLVGPDGQDGFQFGGITFFNSRASLDSNPFITEGDCRFFPLGVPGLFEEIYAPADYVETVNTLGKDFYAKQERMDFDKGVTLEVQSNPLAICTRPQCLIRGHSSN